MIGKEKYFNILGIKPTTDQKQIKKAYRRQALKYHPDTNKTENAHYNFILISEAYEVLSGQKKPRKSSKANYRPKTKEEIIAEKVKLAKERWKRQQEEELQKDKEYYQKIATGWKWRFFQIFAIYTAIFTTLLSVDYFTVGEQVCVTNEANPDFYDRVLKVREEKFVVTTDDYWFGPAAIPPIRGNYSYLFHDLKSISVITNYDPKYKSNSHSSKLNKYDYFENWELYTVMSFSSVYGAFPFLHLVLMVPLMLIVFKRPNLRFSVWRLVSIWIIYPTIFFLSLSNDRIFYFFELIVGN